MASRLPMTIGSSAFCCSTAACGTRFQSGSERIITAASANWTMDTVWYPPRQLPFCERKYDIISGLTVAPTPQKLCRKLMWLAL